MNVREIAFKCLVDIYTKKQFSNLTLKQAGKALSVEENGLLRQLVYGTLRNYRYVNYQWTHYVDSKPDRKIAILLDMATYQLLLMDKADYAVVMDSVEIAKKIKGGHYVKMVNAVLRKISANGKIAVEGDDKIRLAIETSHPDWLVNLWIAHYGWDKTKEICFDNLKEARLALRVNNLKTSKEELLKDQHFSLGTVNDCLYYDGNIINSNYFKENYVYVQAESSQQVAEVVDPKANDRVLDMCAAPGTKTVSMAIKMQNQGTIIACDLYSQRVELIEQNCTKLGLTNVKTICKDATELAETLENYSFDKVLLDAPCSGLGVLSHKPDIKMSITPNDLDDIIALQRKLLNTAARLVKVNGNLIYSTCTLDKKENEKQIEQFLKEHEEFKLEKQNTIFPADYHSDGFFIAKLIKVC